MPKVNQQMIADRLNLSRATVSRCFTNHPGINPETRAKVFSLAGQLGYKHLDMRTTAKPTKAQEKSFAVLVCSEEEEYYREDYESPGQELLEGISEYLQLRQVGLDFHLVDPKETSLDSEVYQNLIGGSRRKWDGVLLVYPFPKGVTHEIMKQYPCVSLVEQYGSSSLNCVDVDHYKGVAMVINRLYELGHRRIGFYSKSYMVQASWALRRYGAYVEKMTQLGLEIAQEDIINIHPKHMVSLEESFDLAKEGVQRGITAWVCAADHQAYDLIEGLKVRGIKCPQDVSITGFDGIQKPRNGPELGTILIPYREIGFTAAKRLNDLLNKRFTSAQHILLSCRLREGETMAQPGA